MKIPDTYHLSVLSIFHLGCMQRLRAMVSDAEEFSDMTVIYC